MKILKLSIIYIITGLIILGAFYIASNVGFPP